MPRSRLGSKRQRPDGSWEVRVTHGRRRDGSPRSVSRVVATEAEADAAIVSIAAEMGRSPSMGDSMTVDQYFWGVFYPRKEASRTHATAGFYRSCYRSQVAETFADLPLDAIPKATIRTWAAQLPAQSAPSYVKCLRAILRSAWEDGLMPEEPMRGRLDLPSRDTRPKAVWTAEQAADALSRLRGTDIEPLCLVMLGAGLSASEARACDWENLSADCTEVTVDGAYTEMDGMHEGAEDLATLPHRAGARRVRGEAARAEVQRSHLPQPARPAHGAGDHAQAVGGALRGPAMRPPYARGASARTDVGDAVDLHEPLARHARDLDAARGRAGRAELRYPRPLPKSFV